MYNKAFLLPKCNTIFESDIRNFSGLRENMRGEDSSSYTGQDTTLNKLLETEASVPMDKGDKSQGSSSPKSPYSSLLLPIIR